MTPELHEARELARALYAATQELADSLGDVARINPELDVDERLPHWLTGITGAPETWQRDDEEITLRDVDPEAVYATEDDDYDDERAEAHTGHRDDEQ